VYSLRVTMRNTTTPAFGTFMADAATGETLVQPRRAGSHTARLVARADGSAEEVVVLEWRFEVASRPPTAPSSGGGGGGGDGARDCDWIVGGLGLVGLACLGLAVLACVALGGWRCWAVCMRTRPTDFDAKFQQLVANGDIGVDARTGDDASIADADAGPEPGQGQGQGPEDPGAAGFDRSRRKAQRRQSSARPEIRKRASTHWMMRRHVFTSTRATPNTRAATRNGTVGHFLSILLTPLHVRCTPWAARADEQTKSN